MEFAPGTDYPTKRLTKQKSLDAGLFALQAEIDDDSAAPSHFQAVVEEFNSLQLLTDKPMSFGERILTYPSATTFWTAPKNRYPDILPKEETRVLLKNTGVDGSEYINANYVFGKQYIATQAPIPTTFADFWRMVWEQETSVVVMLTKLTERKQVRAAIYWPQRVGESTQFGNITVQLLHEVPMDSIECRIFGIADSTSPAAGVRRVAHMHYTGWPDFGVPQSTAEIIDLLRITNYFRARLGCDRPMITHCSAGIGRAGTFIAIHQAAQQMAASGQRPRILDLVFAMRQCRCGMVQTGDQYLFIHRALYTLERMKHTYTISASSDSSSCSALPDRLAALTAVISGVPNLLPTSPEEEGTRPLITAHSAPTLFPSSSSSAPSTQSEPPLSSSPMTPAGSPYPDSPLASPNTAAPVSPSPSSTVSPLTRKRQRKGSAAGHPMTCLLDNASSTPPSSTSCNNSGGMECN